MLLATGLLAGCSMKQMAVDMVGDAMAGGGVYFADNDPELAYEAIPFGLKTYESLLTPRPITRACAWRRPGVSVPTPI